jgi:hypothetical protein
MSLCQEMVEDMADERKEEREGKLVEVQRKLVEVQTKLVEMQGELTKIQRQHLELQREQLVEVWGNIAALGILTMMLAERQNPEFILESRKAFERIFGRIYSKKMKFTEMGVVARNEFMDLTDNSEGTGLPRRKTLRRRFLNWLDRG